MEPVLRPRHEPRDRSGDPLQVHGRTLEHVLAGGPIEPHHALELLAQVGDALDAAYARGAVHPNLQPGSVLIDAAGEDRAIVELDPERGDTRSRGEPLQYVSPERILGREGSPASGVYSLSAVLYHCLTGSVPFPHGRGRAVLFWHLHAPRPRATDLRSNLPAGIDGVIARGMATDPAARYQTARALMDDARLALGIARPAAGGAAAADGRARHAEDSRRGVEPGSRTRRALAFFAVVVAVGLAAGAVGFAVAGALDDPQPRSSLASAGSIQLAAPASWKRSFTSSPPVSLRLTDPLILAPIDRAGTRLVAGIANPAASVALLARLHASPPAGDLVALGRMQARRYRAGRLPDFAGPATVYVAPAQRGIATVACLADRPEAAAGFMSRCEGVAGSLRLADGHAAPAGPSAQQTSAVRGSFRRLNAATSRYRSRLRRSPTAAGQAAAARTLARAQVREARALGTLRFVGLARPGGQAAVRALKRAATAYQATARAAFHGDRGRYSAAGRAAIAATAALRRALRMLRVVGYGV